MKKKIFGVMIITLSLCSIQSVKAETYYTNPNGIELTEFQYKTLVDMFSTEKVDELTETDYNVLHVERMIEGQFDYVTREFESPEDYNPGGIVPYVYHETPSKKLTMASSCYSDYCFVSVYLGWKKVPAVTSYDVMGIRLTNSTLYDSTNTFVAKMDGNITTTYARAVRASNGLADVFKITSGIDYATMDARVTPSSNGVLYGSYQHAKKTISLANASNFTFSGTGYGSVFLWPSSIRSSYDEMGGVWMKLY